jgi:hypothetical protein
MAITNGDSRAQLAQLIEHLSQSHGDRISLARRRGCSWRATRGGSDGSAFGGPRCFLHRRQVVLAVVLDFLAVRSLVLVFVVALGNVFDSGGLSRRLLRSRNSFELDRTFLLVLLGRSTSMGVADRARDGGGGGGGGGSGDVVGLVFDLVISEDLFFFVQKREGRMLAFIDLVSFRFFMVMIDVVMKKFALTGTRRQRHLGRTSFCRRHHFLSARSFSKKKAVTVVTRSRTLVLVGCFFLFLWQRRSMLARSTLRCMA